MLINYINYNSSKFLSKKINALKMNFDLNNNTNNKTLEIKETNEYLDTTVKEEVRVYFNNLPECLVKCKGAPDLFSFFWLQKIGRTDLWSLVKKNDFIISKKYKEINTKLIQKNSIEKRNNFLFYKNKSKISLGSVMEEKMLNYTNKITEITNFTNVVTGYQNNTIYGEKSAISGDKNSIKIKILSIFSLKKNIRFFIIFILCNLVNTFQILYR
nr:CMESO_55 [Cryptomonas curvata]|mmetsp:Transcript_40819/g.85224  ORF Transcript_40819/g.85224 Transcript_40819/m.85224 type:complete len:214 (-) Transcript_40819:1292-1933(-)